MKFYIKLQEYIRTPAYFADKDKLMERDFVCYSDFGAVGDGVTNDFFAIRAAHDFANENGLPVRAERGKTYLITETEQDGVARPASIKTDTDFCGATFIIDDTRLSWSDAANKTFNSNVFLVESPYQSCKVEKEYIDKINASGGIKRDSVKRIDVGLGFPAMLILHNNSTRHFIRFGGNQNSGSAQKELIVVDAEGNIDENTPFLFDYSHVDSITAIRIDIPTLTVQNGSFISKASRVNIDPEYHSIARGFRIFRPNTHIKDIVHKIEGELGKYEPVYEDAEGLSYSAVNDGYTYRGGKIYGKDGAEYEGDKVKPFIGHSYSGILQMNSTHNVLIENVTFQSRRYYLQGTYDIGGFMSNMLVFKNCRQSNFFANDDPEHPLRLSFGKWWGIAGTNYCKNMIYDGCQLTRYDAHSGVCNGKVINSEIGKILLTGGGDMLIENCKIYYDRGPSIALRSDYGSTWNGNITIRNCKMASSLGDISPSAILTSMSANHNFGYRTHFPNISIDDLEIDNAPAEVKLLYDFDDDPVSGGFFYRSVNDKNIAIEGAVSSDGKPNQNPYTPPEYIKVINNEGNGYSITLPDTPFFKDTEISGIEIIK